MKNQIKIDQVKLEEVEQLRQLAMTTFTETFGHHNTEEQLQDFYHKDYSLDILSKEIIDPESRVYFIRYQNDVAGFLKLSWGNSQSEHELENAFEIHRLYLLNEFQGKGLGKALMSFALEEAHASGKDWVWLGVWEHNLKAQSLYQKYGFEKFSEHTFAVGDLVDTDWLMKKALK